jgi:hypothetical protein
MYCGLCVGRRPAGRFCHSLPSLLPPSPACNELDGASKALAAPSTPAG